MRRWTSMKETAGKQLTLADDARMAFGRTAAIRPGEARANQRFLIHDVTAATCVPVRGEGRGA